MLIIDMFLLTCYPKREVRGCSLGRSGRSGGDEPVAWYSFEGYDSSLIDNV